MPLRPNPIALSALLPALFLCHAARAEQHVQVHIHCKSANADCPRPPAPPKPPAPPAPPHPPALDADEQGTPPPLPALPALPAIPAPPAVPPVPEPKIPAVPPAAHAACNGKPAGSMLTWQLGPGETMRGECADKDGRMAFQLRAYDLEK